MYGYVYLTTNLINQRKYIGQHKSPVFDENYKGSGKLLKQAFDKYGWENFKTEILEECESFESLNEAERRHIEKTDAVYSKEYYNIAYGGANNMGHPLSDEEKLQRRLTAIEVCKRPGYRKQMPDIMKEIQRDGKSWMIGKHHSEETKRKMSKSRSGEKHPMYGKHHSDESRLKMSEAAKRRSHPPTSANYVWINDGVSSKTVPIEKLDEYLSQGYVKGRIINKHKKT